MFISTTVIFIMIVFFVFSWQWKHHIFLFLVFIFGNCIVFIKLKLSFGIKLFFQCFIIAFKRFFFSFHESF
jgi:hypothetical protein